MGQASSANEPTTAAGWAEEMARLRTVRPRPIKKLFGLQGPTPAQAEAHAAAERRWGRAYRRASKEQKRLLKLENEAFRAKAGS